ncbi:hypothetical protein GSF67_11820 [Agrobacterium sp. CGMCC 11546]|nr:hypothetical protein GSF67_11820 [Agrobacterium sp. CGMCC 11546]
MASAVSLLCRVMGFGDVGECGSPPSALPGISPTGGEIESRQGFAFLDSRDSATRAPLANLPPCGGDARQGRGGLSGILRSTDIFPTAFPPAQSRVSQADHFPSPAFYKQKSPAEGRG